MADALPALALVANRQALCFPPNAFAKAQSATVFHFLHGRLVCNLRRSDLGLERLQEGKC